MTSPGPDCTCRELEKHRVWLGGANPANRLKVTGGADLQSMWGPTSSRLRENCRSFLDIYDFAGIPTPR
jgi:hypothetical protein